MFFGLVRLLLAASALVGTGYLTMAVWQGRPSAGPAYLAWVAWLIAVWLAWSAASRLEETFPARCRSCGSFDWQLAMGATAVAGAAQLAVTGSVGGDAAIGKCGNCGEWWRGDRGCAGGVLVASSGCLRIVAVLAVLPVGITLVFFG